MIKDLLKRIIELSFEISTTGAHDIFCDYHGHVNTLNVDVHFGGYKQLAKPDYTYRAYLGIGTEADKCLRLTEIITKLEELNNDK